MSYSDTKQPPKKSFEEVHNPKLPWTLPQIVQIELQDIESGASSIIEGTGRDGLFAS